MPDFHDADPTPPEEVKEPLRQAEETSRAPNPPQRTNDSKVDDLCEVLP